MSQFSFKLSLQLILWFYSFGQVEANCSQDIFKSSKTKQVWFFFFLFFSQAKTCFLATGAAGLSLFPVLWQFWAWSPEKHVNYPRWYHKGSCVSLPLKISQIFHMYLLFITKFLYLRAVRSFITFPAYGPQNRCLKTFFPVLSFNRMPVP